MIFPLPFCHPGNQSQKKSLFPHCTQATVTAGYTRDEEATHEPRYVDSKFGFFPSHHIFLSFAFSLYSSVAFWDLANISSVRARLGTLQWISDFCLFWYLRESVCFVWTIQEEINPLSLTGRKKKALKIGVFGEAQSLSCDVQGFLTLFWESCWPQRTLESPSAAWRKSRWQGVPAPHLLKIEY